jgi:ABC-type multidrug transport system fused ATPase/permease subunit
MTIVFKIFKILGKEWRKKLIFLSLLSITAAIFEILSIASVIPFFGILANQDKFYSQGNIVYIAKIFNLQTTNELIIFFTIFFSLIIIIATFVRLFHLSYQTRVSVEIGAELSSRLYKNMLEDDFISQISRNSSVVLSGAEKARMLVSHLITPVLTIMTSSILILGIVGTSVILNPKLVLTIFLSIAFILIAISYFTKKITRLKSQEYATKQLLLTKYIQEGLGSYRDLKIYSTERYHYEKYKSSVNSMQKALASILTLAGSPRFLVEGLGTILLVIVSLASFLQLNNQNSQEDISINFFLPTLGAIVYAIQKLLPLAQNLYSSIITIRGGEKSVEDVITLLDNEIINEEISINSLELTGDICLQNVSFRYSRTGDSILKNINLIIKKGGIVGIIGKSGHGKSTLIDIIMGLLYPEHGKVFVGNTQISKKNSYLWHKKIAYVPQTIYLSDTTVAENIAIGEEKEKIDIIRLIDSCKRAGILDFVQSLENGFDYIVGERGEGFSGGQRQRIALARAFYKNAEYIFLDEATNSLDKETESNILKLLFESDKKETIIIITHGIESNKYFSQTVKIINGEIIT